MLCRLKKDSISSEDAPKWSSSATSRLTSPDFPVSTIQGTPGRSLGHGGSKACMASAYAGGDVAKQASSRGMPIVFFIVASLGRCVSSLTGARKIGRAHVCTPVTNAQLVCRLLLEKKKTQTKQNTNITVATQK